MAVVIGIDPSYTATGVCIWENGYVKTFTVKTAAGMARVHRQRHIVEQVLVYAPMTTATLIEGVYASRFGGRTSLDLAGLHDVLVYEFTRLGIPVGVPGIKGNKAFATGNGNADKKAMVAAARTLLGVIVANHNEADALWLATMGAVDMGGHTNLWPPRSSHPDVVAAQRKRTANLAKIAWVGGIKPDMLEEM